MKRDPCLDPTLCHVHLRMLWTGETQAKKWSSSTITPANWPFSTLGTWSRRLRSSLLPWWTSAHTLAKACMPRSTSPPMLGRNDVKRSHVELWSCCRFCSKRFELCRCGARVFASCSTIIRMATRSVPNLELQAASAVSFCGNPAVEACRGPAPEEARKRDAEWGTGRKSGHRAAFCIPLIVPRSIAYNIFERHTCHGCRYVKSDCFILFHIFVCGASCHLHQLEQDAWVRMWACLRPDMAERTATDSAGQERPIKLGSKVFLFDIFVR